jgi:hypothetical protein
MGVRIFTITLIQQEGYDILIFTNEKQQWCNPIPTWIFNYHWNFLYLEPILFSSNWYFATFAQSKNCGARETATASEQLWNNIRF